jgi:maleate isomerase
MARTTPQRRLGVIVPSSNTVVEDAMRAHMPDAVALHVSRFHVVTISDGRQSRAQFEQDAMLAAAAALADAKVDHILWAGTAASWLGEAHDRTFVEAVREQLGLPATTAVTAIRRRLAALGVRRIGLVTPYVADLEARIIANFAGLGLETAASERLDITINTAYAQVDEVTLTAMVDRVAAAGPEAIVILCTNLAGDRVARLATQRLGIPVLDSVEVAFADALHFLSGSNGPHV